MPEANAPDPEGFFVARVRGEDAVRDAPHPMLEGGGFEEELPAAPGDEVLGELPWTYGDDTLVALPRDPRTLFLYWDHAPATLAAAFAGLEGGHAQLWLFAGGGEGWERVRVVDFALESRCYYLHDLEPGRTYRVEIHVVDRRGRERLVPHPSGAALMPVLGPSPVVEDRFVSVPWDTPLPSLLGPGSPGGPFSEAARALLARRSGWRGGAGEGGDGGRPSSPSSPFGPFGGEGRS